MVRALVVDFDGTLTEGDRPDDDVLESLRVLRGSGHHVVMATGRILTELLEVFPDALSFVDSIVCENGAVIVTSAGAQRIVAPVPAELDSALTERGIEFRRGDVLLAGTADSATGVLEVVHSLGLDVQLVFNRAELMVLPAGVSKAVGVGAALGAFGLSPHNAAAIGDAENDHSLLGACELAVAPANAVESVKAHADLVLPQRDGEAVSELAARLGDRRELPRSSRWTVRIGNDAHDSPVTLRVSGTSMLVAGSTSAGKSYLAGLIAEQLIEQGYNTLVVDPEGDHAGLRHLPNVVWLGGADLPRSPEAMGRLLGRPMGNVVVDLSTLGLDDRIRWLAQLPEFLAAERARYGAPHWVILDEAHLVANDAGRVAALFAGGMSQYCFVTFLPDLLDPSIAEHVDDVILVGHGGDTMQNLLARLSADPTINPSALHRAVLDAGPGVATVVERGVGLVGCRLTARLTSHVRHWHKYATERMPQHAFLFRSSEKARTGRTAASLAELHDNLSSCAPSVIAHHSRHGDFSRWIRDVTGDRILAESIERAEHGVGSGTPIETVRASLVEAIRRRYLTE
jgi:hydroxymethylpyrimidine pyrophosphatase-like HAD family hydrolase